MVAAVIAANQTAAGGRSRRAILNKASATVLFRLLGGSLIRETGGRIEHVLRDLIVQIALPLRPANWDAIVNRLDQEARGGRIQVNPVIEDTGQNPRASNGGDLSWISELPVGAKDELESALEAVVDDVWDEALYQRDQLWSLPWPPNPRPSRQLLLSLIAAVWTYYDDVHPVGKRYDKENNAAFVALALTQLYGRQGGQGGLGKIQQAIALEVTATGIVITISLIEAAVIGAGLGLLFCIGIDCFGMRTGLIRAFSGTGEDDATPMPARRPGGGSSSAGSSGSGGTGSLSQVDLQNAIQQLLRDERVFLDRMCAGFLAIGHGFQAREFLLVMLSETNGKMNPSQVYGGALGMSQLILSEVQKVRPGMTKEQYISLSREDQIEVIIDHLLRQIDGNYQGGTPLRGTAPSTWTTTQRAAVLYWMNAGYPGSGNIDSVLASPTFPGSKGAYDHLPPAKAAEYYDGTKIIDVAPPYGKMTLADFEQTLITRQKGDPWKIWSGALDQACPQP